MEIAAGIASSAALDLKEEDDSLVLKKRGSGYIVGRCLLKEWSRCIVNLNIYFRKVSRF